MALSPLATTLPFAVSAQLQPDVDDSRTISSQRHSVAFCAFCVLGGGDYFFWFLALSYVCTIATYQMMGVSPFFSMFKESTIWGYRHDQIQKEKGGG